jgi:hypothetical protein
MRIRSIKPEFWRSDDITALSREHRLLFIGLWSYVDDNGVGMDDFRAIAADLFALEDDQKEVRDYVREGLATLSRALLIARYEVSGKRYIFIRTWDSHQKIDRPSKSRHPRPPEGWEPPTSDDDPRGGHLREVSRDPRESLDAGAGEQGNRGTEEKDSSSAAAADEEPAQLPLGKASAPRPDVDQLVAHLAACIEANTEQPVKVGKQWRTSARLLLDKDLAHESDPLGLALRLIDWATNDEFWHTNILSMPTFREKFPQLRLKARAEWQRRNAARSPQDMPDRISGWQSLKTGTDDRHLHALPRGDHPC